MYWIANRWKTKLIILIILYIFFLPSYQLYILKKWENPINVTIYPVLSGKQLNQLSQLDKINEDSFEQLQLFVDDSARKYMPNVNRVVNLKVDKSLKNKLPNKIFDSYNFFSRTVWTLQLKLWAFFNLPLGVNDDTLQIIAAYGEEDNDHPYWPSKDYFQFGLGLIGVDYLPNKGLIKEKNNVHLTLSFLHILGASIKSDANGVPIVPFGLADSSIRPLYNQVNAEIMAGKFPISQNQVITAYTLNMCKVGALTANELNWFKIK